MHLFVSFTKLNHTSLGELEYVIQMSNSIYRRLAITFSIFPLLINGYLFKDIQTVGNLENIAFCHIARFGSQHKMAI